jgi:hypothetical protein
VVQGYPPIDVIAPASSLEPFEPSNDSDGGVVLSDDNEESRAFEQPYLDDHMGLGTSGYASRLQAKTLHQGLNWCDRGFHVDFGTDEYIPLHRGRLLGHGAQGMCRSRQQAT